MKFNWSKPEFKRVDPRTIKDDPILTPKRDEKWMELAEACIAGTLPMYYAELTLGSLIPFDIDYRPDLDERGIGMIDQYMKEASEGSISKPIVYQRGFWFVVSDDYLVFLAAVLGQPDYCPCFVMGELRHLGARNIQIVPKESVKKIIFGE